MVGVVWQPLVYGWQFGIPSYAFVYPGGTVGLGVALNICDATMISLMPRRTVISLMPARTAIRHCEDEP